MEQIIVLSINTLLMPYKCMMYFMSILKRNCFKRIYSSPPPAFGGRRRKVTIYRRPQKGAGKVAIYRSPLKGAGQFEQFILQKINTDRNAIIPVFNRGFVLWIVFYGIAKKGRINAYQRVSSASVTGLLFSS